MRLKYIYQHSLALWMARMNFSHPCPRWFGWLDARFACKSSKSLQKSFKRSVPKKKKHQDQTTNIMIDIIWLIWMLTKIHTDWYRQPLTTILFGHQIAPPWRIQRYDERAQHLRTRQCRGATHGTTKKWWENDETWWSIWWCSRHIVHSWKQCLEHIGDAIMQASLGCQRKGNWAFGMA